MPFLILTRKGFDDIVPRVELAGAVFHLNPGVASDAEVARLRDAGTIVHVLESTVDSQVVGDGETVWIERVLPESMPAIPASAASRQPAALHGRLASTAAMLANSALRRIRNPGTGRQLMLMPCFGFGNAGKLWV